MGTGRASRIVAGLIDPSRLPYAWLRPLLPQTHFIHCSLSRHSGGSVMSVSPFSPTTEKNHPIKAHYSSNSSEKTHTNLGRAGDRTAADLLEWWTVVFVFTGSNVSRFFLPATNKERPTQLLFFLPPPPLSLRHARLDSAPRPPPHLPHARWRLRGGGKDEKPAWGMGEQGTVTRRRRSFSTWNKKEFINKYIYMFFIINDDFSVVLHWFTFCKMLSCTFIVAFVECVLLKHY